MAKCSVCGHALKKEARFCAHCGTCVEQENAEGGEAQFPVEQSAGDPFGDIWQPVEAEPVKKKKKLIVGLVTGLVALLAVLLAMPGVHTAINNHKARALLDAGDYAAVVALLENATDEAGVALWEDARERLTLQQAEELWNDGDYEGVVEKLQGESSAAAKVLWQAAQDKLTLQQAQALLDAGDYEAALACLEGVDDPEAQELRLLAEEQRVRAEICALAAEKNYGGALECLYDSGIEDEPLAAWLGFLQDSRSAFPVSEGAEHLQALLQKGEALLAEQELSAEQSATVEELLAAINDILALDAAVQVQNTDLVRLMDGALSYIDELAAGEAFKVGSAVEYVENCAIQLDDIVAAVHSLDGVELMPDAVESLVLLQEDFHQLKESITSSLEKYKKDVTAVFAEIGDLWPIRREEMGEEYAAWQEYCATAPARLYGQYLELA